jgi:hypothetical protein
MSRVDGFTTVFPALSANIPSIFPQETGLLRVHLVSDASIVSLPGCANVTYLPDDLKESPGWQQLKERDSRAGTCPRQQC